MANILNRDKQIQIIKMLVEGMSIRSVERVTCVHLDTIMRLAVRVDRHCQAPTDEHVRGVRCQHAQCDEIWCYVGKKQRRIELDDSPDFDDTYAFVAFDQ